MVFILRGYVDCRHVRIACVATIIFFLSGYADAGRDQGTDFELLSKEWWEYAKKLFYHRLRLGKIYEI